MQQDNTSEVEIGPRELLRIFWHGRGLIVLITVVFTGISIAAIFLSTKIYQATVLISPVADESGGSRLSSLISQVGGGLASLADIPGLPSPANTQKAEIVAVLQSEAITERYIRENGLLPVLYPKEWDAVRQQWKADDPKKIPTLWKANVAFKKNIRYVVTDLKSGLVTMVIKWKDPVLAAKWANGLVRLANDYLRDKTISEAERNIAYLGEQAAKTDVLGVKEAIYSILQNEIKKMMLARGSAEYALKVIDPAVAPEKPSSPQPVVWALMGFFGGFFVSLAVVFVRHRWTP
jgi:uncharacterized protein involved in exopolysaccharide biosynthesis